MYEIYCGNDLVYRPGDADYAAYNVTLERELNKSGTLEFTLPPTNPMCAELKIMLSVVTVKRDGADHWRGRVLSAKRDFYNCRAFVCEGELAYLNDSMMQKSEYTGTVSNFLARLLSNHNTQMAAQTDKCMYRGNVDVVDALGSAKKWETDTGTTWSIIQKQLLDVYDGYLQLRSANGRLYLDYLKPSSFLVECHQRIMFGQNLIDFEEYINAAEIYTVVIPIGKDGLTIESVNDGKNYLTDETARLLYGRIVRVIEYSDIEDAAQLKSTAAVELAQATRSITELTIDAVDLKEAIIPDLPFIPPSEAFDIGKKIRAISQPHGLDVIILCTKTSIPLAEADKAKYTLGPVGKKITKKEG